MSVAKMNLNEIKVVGQPKYDGERLLVHYHNGKTYCTSRRISIKTNKYNELQANLPTLHAQLKGIGYTVLDGEVYSKDWATIAGITKSLPERAIALQQDNEVKYAVFDCLYFDGQDIRDLPYSERLVIAQNVVTTLNKSNVHLVDTIEILSAKHAGTFMDECIANGFEGAVIKRTDKTYTDKRAMLKLKKSETLDCVVYDKIQGNGKYSDTIGALSLGYYDADKDTIIHITQCAPGTDADRNMWRDNWDSMKLSVVEVKCQEVTKQSLRHPVIIRIRNDKDYTMCTKETIFKGVENEDEN